MTVVFLLNRVPTKGVAGMTPFEAYHGRKPAVHFLRTFGCVAHIKTTRPHLKKLEDRSTPMIFIGYEPGSKAYRLYDPVTQCAHVSRDVVFDERRAWDWNTSASDAAARTSELVIEEMITVEQPVIPIGATPSPPPAPPASPEFVSPPPDAAEHLDAEHDDDVLVRFRTMENILGSASPRGQAPRTLCHELLLQVGEEPATFVEAEKDKSWRAAMMEEMRSIEENRT